MLCCLSKQLRTVQHLNLAHNALGKAFKQKQKFGPSAAEDFGTAVAKNMTLLHFDFSGNHFNLETMKVLAQLFRKNHTILGLHLDCEQHGYVDSFGFIKILSNEKVLRDNEFHICLCGFF